MKIVALLPMKAHSSRVPGKNFRTLRGKPLYRWMLDTLLSISEISSIVINTDAEEILRSQKLQSNPRITIRERPQTLRGDEVSMNRVIEDDVCAVYADLYLMTHTTNPLLSRTVIEDAIATFINEREYDSLFSVTRYQSRFYRSDGTPINHDPDNLVPTQDLEPWFEENSNLYLFTRDSFTRTGARIGKRPLLFVTPLLQSVDIDGPDDWAMAEALLDTVGQ